LNQFFFYVRAEIKVNKLMFHNKNKTSLSCTKEAKSGKTTGILHALLKVPDFIWYFLFGITTL
jgi:hypothetical protein